MLNLRGRGGSAGEIEAMIRMLHGEKSIWHGEVVALTHAGTRSAKEVMAYRMQVEGVGTVVGETTAGAVIPAAFKEVGGDAVLMFPYMTLPRYTELLEAKGVTPDVLVADYIPYSAGADPILKAGVATLEAQCAALDGESSKEHRVTRGEPDWACSGQSMACFYPWSVLPLADLSARHSRGRSEETQCRFSPRALTVKSHSVFPTPTRPGVASRVERIWS